MYTSIIPPNHIQRRHIMKYSINVILALLFVSSSALAQESSRSLTVAEMANYKSPGTAQLISVIVTGGGHIYAGETGKGILLLGVAIGAPLAGLFISAATVGTTCGVYGYCYSSGGTLIPLYLGSALAVGAWIYGIIDSDDAAMRHNEQFGLYSSRIQVGPTVSMVGSKAAYGLGIHVKL